MSTKLSLNELDELMTDLETAYDDLRFDEDLNESIDFSELGLDINLEN